MMVVIKPHHFLDIIKLHGAGFAHFTPNGEYGHDFYRVGNDVLASPSLPLRLTTGQDYICGPCVHLGAGGLCVDTIGHIAGVTSKDAWNKTLDGRLLAACGLREGQELTARALCEALLQNAGAIYEVWREDDAAATQKRYDLFCAGARQYLAGPQ